MTLLALLTLLLFALFAGVLVYFLTGIARRLESIGAREPSTMGHRSAYPSHLARIALGVSAIDREVSALSQEAPKLNERLERLVEGLGAIKNSVEGIIQAVKRQGAY